MQYIRLYKLVRALFKFRLLLGGLVLLEQIAKAGLKRRARTPRKQD